MDEFNGKTIDIEMEETCVLHVGSVFAPLLDSTEWNRPSRSISCGNPSCSERVE